MSRLSHSPISESPQRGKRMRTMINNDEPNQNNDEVCLQFERSQETLLSCISSSQSQISEDTKGEVSDYSTSDTINSATYSFVIASTSKQQDQDSSNRYASLPTKGRIPKSDASNSNFCHNHDDDYEDDEYNKAQDDDVNQDNNDSGDDDEASDDDIDDDNDEVDEDEEIDEREYSGDSDGDDDEEDHFVQFSDGRESLSSGYADIDDFEDEANEDEEDDSDPDDEITNCQPEEYLIHDPTPDAPYPKPEWNTIRELQSRRYGFTSSKSHVKSSMYWFERYANNSLWAIQRLELSRRLEAHDGCVNSLDFNSDGNLICSGSDDQDVCLWNWQQDELMKKIKTGHTDNIFQSKFCCDDQSIVTSSKDGTVRLVNIEKAISEVLLTQQGEIGKLAFYTPQTILTCGENGNVNFVDLRTRATSKLFTVNDHEKQNYKPELHTIDVHPFDTYKVVVAGGTPFVYLYDLRRLKHNPNDIEHRPTYYPSDLVDTGNIVTSTAFNNKGDKLLISYNDDDLVVCQTDTYEVLHRYKGHRNKKTIKGCAWFGDNYVLSGSDDGHIYGWDLISEHIVCFLDADVKGIVNCLVTHPTLPVLASSGLDHNVKVWEPISKVWPQTLKGIKPHICRNTMRRNRLKKNVFTPSSVHFQPLESDEND